MQVTPPIDYVWASQNLATTPDESCVCGWTMALVDGIAMTLYYHIFGYQKEQRDTGKRTLKLLKICIIAPCLTCMTHIF